MIFQWQLGDLNASVAVNVVVDLYVYDLPVAIKYASRKSNNIRVFVFLDCKAIAERKKYALPENEDWWATDGLT